jgi:hypothetical protein
MQESARDAIVRAPVGDVEDFVMGLPTFGYQDSDSLRACPQCQHGTAFLRAALRKIHEKLNKRKRSFGLNITVVDPEPVTSILTTFWSI